MCELLVRVVDKVHEKDPEKDAQLHKAGDVICIAEDGHPWTKRERANPDWRIVALPGVSRKELEYLTRPPQGKPGEIRPRRAYKVNVDALGIDSAARAKVDAGQKDASYSKQTLAAAVQLKEGAAPLPTEVAEAIKEALR